MAFTCTSSAMCPNGRPDGVRATEQFDFGCNSNNKWSFGQFFDFTAARHENPIANFYTALRMDCAACFTRHSTASSSSSFLPFNQVTHCVNCSSDCINAAGQAPVMCYRHVGPLEQSCCNVYLNGLCRSSCPDSSYALNSKRECIILDCGPAPTVYGSRSV